MKSGLNCLRKIKLQQNLRWRLLIEGQSRSLDEDLLGHSKRSPGKVSGLETSQEIDSEMDREKLLWQLDSRPERNRDRDRVDRGPDRTRIYF